jgi:hypothetical protein
LAINIIFLRVARALPPRSALFSAHFTFWPAARYQTRAANIQKRILHDFYLALTVPVDPGRPLKALAAHLL